MEAGVPVVLFRLGFPLGLHRPLVRSTVPDGESGDADNGTQQQHDGLDGLPYALCGGEERR
ncbi:MAG: hypothetical protein ABIS21_07960 [Acidimicrobiales bacterium]